jgi:hypothetical protein
MSGNFPADYFEAWKVVKGVVTPQDEDQFLTLDTQNTKGKIVVTGHVKFVPDPNAVNLSPPNGNWKLNTGKGYDPTDNPNIGTNIQPWNYGPLSGWKDVEGIVHAMSVTYNCCCKNFPEQVVGLPPGT